MTHISHLHRKGFLFFLLTFLLVAGCKDEENNVIPDVPVDIHIDLANCSELLAPGNSVTFPGAGYGGVVVYNNLHEYYAFDAACTHEANGLCRLFTQEEVTENCSGFKIKLGTVLDSCSCCGSNFIYTGGYPSKGPASVALKQYRTAVSGNTLRVFN